MTKSYIRTCLASVFTVVIFVWSMTICWAQSIEETSFFYPGKDDLSSSLVGVTNIKIITPTMHRGVTLSELKAMVSRPWYELYQDLDNVWHFEKAQLIIGEAQDECLMEQVPYVTTQAVQETFELDEYVRPGYVFPGFRLLISGVYLAQPTPLSVEPVSVIETGQSYTFEFGGAFYTLNAEGVRSATDDYDACDFGMAVADYKLFLSESDAGQKQMLTAHPFCLTAIYFIGDLDGDGKPDLILNRPSNYEEEYLILYLSSYAQEGELVRPVALLSRGFDC